MPYTLQLVATGMVTFRPAAVTFPATVPDLTFVMMDNPTRRLSANYPAFTIPKHVGFLLAEQRNVVSGSAWRALDFAPNRFGYAGFLLDKERLSFASDPNRPETHAIAFDSSMNEIAHIANIDPALSMEPLFATLTPPSLDPIAGQFFLESGSVWADGRASRVRFRTAAGTPGPEVVIKNEVYISIDLPNDSFTIVSQALRTGTDLSPMRFRFAAGQNRMRIYFGSAPPGALQEVPSGTSVLPHPQDIDFELYYDISRGGPAAHRPIPHRQGGGPVPGSERCPPLQNT